jgi:hypothetical protein
VNMGEILDNKYSKCTTNCLSYLKFALDDVTFRLMCNVYLKYIAGRVAKKTPFFIPLFQSRYSFLLTKNRPNSKPRIFFTRVKLSNFEFTEGRKYKHSKRIRVHSFILMSTFEVLHWKHIGLKICIQFST